MLANVSSLKVKTYLDNYPVDSRGHRIATSSSFKPFR